MSWLLNSDFVDFHWDLFRHFFIAVYHLCSLYFELIQFILEIVLNWSFRCFHLCVKLLQRGWDLWNYWCWWLHIWQLCLRYLLYDSRRNWLRSCARALSYGHLWASLRLSGSRYWSIGLALSGDTSYWLVQLRLVCRDISHWLVCRCGHL